MSTDKQTILVVGGGGREHALAWKLAQSPRAGSVLVAPGNAGTATEAGVRNVDVGAEDLPGLVRLCADEAVDLVVVGPEAPLAAGLVDRLEEAGVRVFGPRQAAAELEASKAFTKDFLARHQVPTAAYGNFDDAATALQFLTNMAPPYVIKADGLAAGKGVVVTEDYAEAEAAVRDMLSGNRFGAAGARVVIEEFLPGEEASFIAVVDGETLLPLASSQDHKRVGDGDSGPNTGGMGAYSPAPVLDDALQARVMDEIMRPVVRGLAAEGRRFRGFLYCGLMIAPDGTPKVVEFNVRLGDPETQPILMRLESDLLSLLEAAVDGELEAQTLRWTEQSCVGVVLAAEHYPASPAKGDVISGLETDLGPQTKVFHAGTRADGDTVLTAGGRVLCACGLGDTLAQAQERAYVAADAISFRGMHCRRDIGSRGLNRD